jgi:hypothetical protein
MRAGDFRGYVETEAEALVRRLRVSAEEWLKKLLRNNFVDRVALVPTVSSNPFSSADADTRTGPLGAPCFAALATRFEAT